MSKVKAIINHLKELDQIRESDWQNAINELEEDAAPSVPTAPQEGEA